MALRAAEEAHQTGRSSLLHFDLSGEAAAEAGMICGGELELLIELITAQQANIHLFDELLRAWDAGQESLLCTAFAVQGQEARILSRTRDASLLHGEVPLGLRRDAEQQQARRLRSPSSSSEDGYTVLMEPVCAPGTAFIAGAGHVGRATAELAASVGFATVVLDDREEFLDLERFPRSSKLHLVNRFEGCFQGCSVASGDFIVILTRGHAHDQTVLAEALQTPARYIGMIGSRRKRDAVYSRLLEQGFSRPDLDRVHCPIGLSIGADTPEEIAVSIVAELIQERAKE
jgi:xanthine dehydrogenase accessory factor